MREGCDHKDSDGLQTIINELDLNVFRPGTGLSGIMTQHKILVSGSDGKALFKASQILEKNGYDITTASYSDRGIERLNDGGVALALIDCAPDDPQLSAKLQLFRKVSPETMIVLQINHMDASSIMTVYNSDADDCICKPYQPEELLFRVGKNIKTHEFKKNIRLRKRIFSNCCICKKVRTDDYGSAKDKWREVEDFLKEEMDILLSSTYCPKCAQTVQNDLLVHVERLKA